MQRYPIIKDRKIKIAVVGCGRISRNHFGSIEAHNDELELAAICDINPVVLAEHAEHVPVVRWAESLSPFEIQDPR